MLNLPAAELSLPGLELQVLTPAEVPSKFDLTFYVSEAAGGGRGSTWSTTPTSSTRRGWRTLLAQLESLLAQAVERPETPVEHLSLVTAAARAAAARSRGAARRRLDRRRPRALRGAGRAGSRAPGGGRRRGGLELRRPAGRRAGAWRAGSRRTGCGQASAVAIFAHRSAPLVPAVLGTLIAGAAFMVLDPAYPAPRLVEMLAARQRRAPGSPWRRRGRCRTAVLDWLASRRLPRLELPAGGNAALASVAAFAAVAPRGRGRPAGCRPCIGFTSGSTGGPKADARAARLALALPADPLRGARPRARRPLLDALRAGARPAAARHLHPALPGRGDRRARPGRHRDRRPAGGVDAAGTGDGGEPDPRPSPSSSPSLRRTASWRWSPACAGRSWSARR